MLKKILVFDKGGRKERMELIKKNQAPKDFLQSLDSLRENGFKIKHLSSTSAYKKSPLCLIFKPIEEIFSRISNIGLRPLSVFNFSNIINSSDYVVSLTDGFSISLGFYYAFINKKNKIRLAGAFHKLSDYDSKLPKFLKNIYFKIFTIILKRLDFVIFYGEADRTNSIKTFNIETKKTFTIKFGVDTDFWKPFNHSSFESNYIFSIGQDPGRDFNTLLKVNTKKRIHIHTSLIKAQNDNKFEITNGSYHKYKKSLTDLEIRSLYQKSFVVVVPLKNVYQPSGYSVTLQALSCGKPVILTLTKGLWAPQLFKSFENCILVNPYKKEEIEDAIKFLEESKDIYEKICTNARSTAINYFSLENAYASTYELFKKFN
ncbi:MAG: glycosyltransferase [Prochlorococcus marinus CUG1438]|nr:glycosyltransferase [Prochlorococcus marinus CUG1438]